jgi:hypothetical protein
MIIIIKKHHKFLKRDREAMFKRKRRAKGEK